jgi:hypothetical protein
MILAPFAPTGATGPSGSTGGSAGTTGTSAPSGTAGTSGTTGPSGPQFDPEAARKSLGDFLSQLMTNRAESDENFAYEYRDFKLPELVDNLISWADPTYPSPSADQGRDSPTLKQAPFYTISELHMIDLMDDTLYDMFAPTLTISPTPGINVNTMDQATARALVPQMTKDETSEFFKFRDSEEEDNLFKKSEEFFTYLQNKVGAFRGSQSEVDRYKQGLEKRNIRIVTDETQFRIVVQAQVNSATRLIDVMLTMVNPEATKKGEAPPSSSSGKGKAPSFLIHFMRIL